MSYKVNYRKIWSDVYGPIPFDEDGRSYEIHHIDGDRNNNDISNLACVSIKEHYEIHLSQKDYHAAACVAKRMNLSVEEISKRCSELNKKRMADPEVKKHYSKMMKDRWKNNKKYAEKTKKAAAKSSRKRVADGTHNFLDPEVQKENVKRLTKICRERVKNKTHNFYDADMRKASSERAKKRNSIEYVCPHCGKIGRGVVMKRHHFERCKQKEN